MSGHQIDFMKGFGLNRPYKLIIYISSLVLILSLFTPIQILSNQLVFKKSLQIVVFGIIAWMILYVLEILGSVEYDKKSYSKADSYGYWIFGIEIGYILVTILLLLN